MEYSNNTIDDLTGDGEQKAFISHVLHMKKLVDEGNYGDLPEILEKLRELTSGRTDPIIQNLIDSAQHLCMACLHSQEDVTALARQGPADGSIQGQLGAVIALLEKTGAETKPPDVHQAERQGFGSLMRTMLRLFRPRMTRRAPASPQNPVSDTADRDGIGTQPSLQAKQSPAFINSEAEDLEENPEDDDYDMKVYFFGAFRVCVNGEFLKDWRNGKSKLIFKYLAANREGPISKEFLMDLFWPRADSDCARNNLNVSIYNIRQSLKYNDENIHPIIYSDGRYGLNPDLSLWTDADDLIESCRSAERCRTEGALEREAVLLKKITGLYRGDFLEEDRFEDWILPLRQKFREIYSTSLVRQADINFDQGCYEDCIDICKKLLSIDMCDEQAHGRLMICYSRTGQNHLAMRQYQCCVEVLARELDITPSSATDDLYQRIRRHAAV